MIGAAREKWSEKYKTGQRPAVFKILQLVDNSMHCQVAAVSRSRRLFTRLSSPRAMSVRTAALVDRRVLYPPIEAFDTGMLKVLPQPLP